MGFQHATDKVTRPQFKWSTTSWIMVRHGVLAPAWCQHLTHRLSDAGYLWTNG